nr:NAD(P)H-binding protein [Paracoccus saliphilus]
MPLTIGISAKLGNLHPAVLERLRPALTPRFIVTGATGLLGQGIVRHLLAHVPAERVGACVREPGRAADIAHLGAQVRRGDFAEPASLAAAFAGAERVLIVSTDKLGEEALALHRAAIKAACDAGARRILYTSHMGALEDSPLAPAAQHWATEKDLETSGVSFTALRHGFYAESCLQMIGHGLQAGELRVPQDGPVSWTVRADLAEADAAILAAEEAWDGITPPLTATEAVTMAEIALMAATVLGREVRHTVVPDEEWVKETTEAGMPAVYAAMLLGIFRAARRGDFAATDPALKTILGRDPKSLRDVIAASCA